MAYQHLVVDVAERVARVTLNRAERHNAFNDVLVMELRDAFRELAGRDDVRVVVLTGAGPSFSAGADLAWLQAAVNYTLEENAQDAYRLVEMLEAIDTCPKPVVGRINGQALAGGTGLVACCDIAICVDTASFAFTEARLGLAPATISPYIVGKIGESNARALFLTAERFDAQRAHQLGLVHEVVPAGELDAAVERTVQTLLNNGPLALAENKALLRGLRSQPAESIGAYTAAMIARLRTSPEGQEGLRSFLEKRRPAWQIKH